MGISSKKVVVKVYFCELYTVKQSQDAPYIRAIVLQFRSLYSLKQRSIHWVDVLLNDFPFII